MSKTIYIMCGPPGGGKSFEIQVMTSILRDEGLGYKIVSRDAIRFAMLKDGEDYFKYENEVFNQFINQINDALATESCSYIFIDATHLNEKSRNKTLDRLHLTEDTIIIPISVRPPLDQCIEQNNRRTGRALVPESVIRKMYESYKAPTYQEKYSYHYIMHKG